jgi:hypothetical protein
VLSQLYGALWASFLAPLVETQETAKKLIKGDHDNPEPAAEVGFRNGILLQLLVQPKFRRSNKKLPVIMYINIVTVLYFRIFDNLAPVQFLGFHIKEILQY